ncbi:alpha carbonic anhydrase 8-like [Teleopsis dalmanni]|uniref:alpha carbonic anhydrase 8-like n=1 Tax=Teleopsis dalmanni TaxID=139649 RepID=UPI0018CDE585|nr:alpha carbonic anhydrase 8-like [Teleopsis dalmanni]
MRANIILFLIGALGLVNGYYRTGFQYYPGTLQFDFPHWVDTIVAQKPAPVAGDKEEKPTPTPVAGDKEEKPTPAPVAGDKEEKPTSAPVAADKEEKPTPAPVAGDDVGTQTPAPLAADEVGKQTSAPVATDKEEKPTPAPVAGDEVGTQTPAPVTNPPIKNEVLEKDVGSATMVDTHTRKKRYVEPLDKFNIPADCQPDPVS